MDKKLINLIYIIIFIYPALRFVYRYIGQLFIPYMLNQDLNWDKRVDKPRILFYILFGGVSYLFWFITIKFFTTIPATGATWLTLLFILASLVFAFMLIFTWTNKFSEQIIPIAEDVSEKIAPQIIESVIQDENSIKLLRKTFEGYFKCSLESLTCLITQTPLSDNRKIIWTDRGDNNNTDSNIQTLIAFIIALFPKCVSGKTLRRKKIQKIAEKYFCDMNNKAIEIKSHSFDQYNRTSNNAPKLKIKELIDSIIKNRC